MGNQISCNSGGVVVSGIGINLDMSIDLGGRVIPPHVGLADVPTQSGATVTKAPGVYADVMITDPNGRICSRRLRNGKIVSSTQSVTNRESKKDPNQNPFDWLQRVSPSITSSWRPFLNRLPHAPEVAEFFPDGTFEVEAYGAKERIPFGKVVQGYAVTANDGSEWQLSMNNRFAEFRRGKYFLKIFFEGTDWLVFVQLKRAPINKNLGGLYLRRAGKVVVSAYPHSPLIDTAAKSCLVHIRKQASLNVRPDWFTVHHKDTGEKAVYVTVDGVWYEAIVGMESYKLHPVFSSETQTESTAADGLLNLYRGGDSSLRGSGLIFGPTDEISVTTPDFTAWRPAGRNQMLVIDDGTDQIVAQYEHSVIAERAQWWVGRRLEFARGRPSWTPYLLLAFLIYVYFAWGVIENQGLLAWANGLLSVVEFFGIGWLMYQVYRLTRMVASDAWLKLHRCF
ncbi:MAG: hypothetical protein AAF662_05235 [Pseudomonadota bacterium]